MAELEIAVSDWKTICEQVALHRHPSLWVGHYAHTDQLGSVHATNPTSEAEHILMLASPFATAKGAVTDTWVVLDRPGHILASHLTDNRLVHWLVPYKRSDTFSLTFSAATKQRPMNPLVEKALASVWNHRLASSDNDFNTAYWYSIQKGAELEAD